MPTQTDVHPSFEYEKPLRTTRKERARLPEPPKQRTSPMIWMWLAFAVVFAILTVIGFWYASQPYMIGS